jgi:hypothetical protein
MSDRNPSRLVLSIIRGAWDEAERLAAREPLDAAAFAGVCRQCGVPSTIHVMLDEADRWDLVGPEARSLLTEARTKVLHDNMLLLARAEQALDLLLAADVVPVALKGLDTLHRFYNGLDGRMLDDVDLLLRPQDLRRGLDALRAGGWTLPTEPETTHYIRSSHHLPTHSPGPIPVDFEIHWNLAQDGRYRIDVAGLLERSEPLDIAGRSVRRLEDHDLTAHLFVHHLSHYFGRGLKWLIDLNALASQPHFEWAKVVDRIREWGATVAAGISLVHLRKLWPELIPAHLLDELPVAAWRRLAMRPLCSDHPLELYRDTGRRRVQLYLAAMTLERPTMLPGWLLHRAVRDRQPGENPLDG